jgi:hypothetical protein
MVAEFLRAEINSVRFGLDTAEAMVRQAATLDLLQDPDLADDEQNRTRRRILGETRGWRRDEKSFAGFPSDVSWHVARLEPGDLPHLTFASNRDWWALSGGSGRPLDLAARIADDRMEPALLEVAEFAAVIDGIKAVSDQVRRGTPLPLPIVVRAPGRERIVIIEGFIRLSALLLAGRGVDADVIVGDVAADTIDQWAGMQERPIGTRTASRRVLGRALALARR